jgi:hypothetical protein
MIVRVAGAARAMAFAVELDQHKSWPVSTAVINLTLGVKSA